MNKSNYPALSGTLVVLYFLSLLMLLLSSCISVKPGAVRSGQKYYESFFVGDEGNQYFIKPLKFTSSTDEMMIDIVFRYNNELKGNATINYSITSDNLYKTPGKLIISTPMQQYTLTDNKLLFNEKYDDKYLSRFSASMPLADVAILFNDIRWEVEMTGYSNAINNNTLGSDERNLNVNHNLVVMKPTKKTQKVIQRLNSNLFVLF